MEAQSADTAAVEVRGWALDGASVLEVTAGDSRPCFFVHCAGSWMLCRDLEAAMNVVWEHSRRRAHLPPQWTTPGSDILEAFGQHWSSLRGLAAGHWWPAEPQQQAAHGSGAGN